MNFIKVMLIIPSRLWKEANITKLILRACNQQLVGGSVTTYGPLALLRLIASGRAVSLSEAL